MRIVYDPIDYLKPELIKDDVLTIKVAPYSASHDAWGFRNHSVPDASEIVAIGDSQTYGINATADNSWPAILQQILNKSVYNMSIGGYGPPQYYHLLKTQALDLHPAVVIVGFYYGNDLMNSYDSVYNNDYFTRFRSPDLPLDLTTTEPETVFDQPISIKHFRAWYRSIPIHIWLKEHSIFYDRFRHLTRKTGAYFGLKTSLYQDSFFSTDKKHISTLFTPQRRLYALNYNTFEVKEGLRISLDMFSEMKTVCDQNDIHFLVVLIPTKESVYSCFIEGNPQITDGEIIDELIENERQINTIVKNYFRNHHIAYIDVLDSLQNELDIRQIYPIYTDGHPNKNGYEVISKEIQNWYMNQIPH